MKYAHLSDLHVGVWRDERMRDYSLKAFIAAIDQCVQEQVDFILFSGDIFNTALPSVDSLKVAVQKMRELKERGIPLYVIAGSHDYSPSGKTMIEVLDEGGLLINVVKGEVVEGKLRLKFTVDEKTGAKITGMLGKKGMLDKHYYEQLDLVPLEVESGYKIFMFHTALSELKPDHLQEMEAHPLSLLPKGFNYYAGGHVHHKSRIDPPGYGPITYPGALFPCNFAELEKYSHGGFYLINDEVIDWVPVKVIGHQHISYLADQKTPEQVQTDLIEHINNLDLINTVLTMRLEGVLQGKTTDINTGRIFEAAYNRGAKVVLKHSVKLQSESFEEIRIETTSIEQIESQLVEEQIGSVSAGLNRDEEKELINTLLTALNTQRKEGETVYVFEERVKQTGQQVVHPNQPTKSKQAGE